MPPLVVNNSPTALSQTYAKFTVWTHAIPLDLQLEQGPGWAFATPGGIHLFCPQLWTASRRTPSRAILLTLPSPSTRPIWSRTSLRFPLREAVAGPRSDAWECPMFSEPRLFWLPR